MNSIQIVVEFLGQTAGYYGFIGMSHREKRACHDRYIDLTRGYYNLVKGKNLDEVEKCMTIIEKNLDTGVTSIFNATKYDLNWEIY